jgi:outer membrane protein assembly factor BamB
MMYRSTRSGRRWLGMVVVAVGMYFLTLSAMAASPSDSDWPQFRGPTGMGLSQAKGLPTKWSDNEGIVWKASLPGAGASSPIIIGDRIYLTSFDGYAAANPNGSLDDLSRAVHCLSAKDGKVVWNAPVKVEAPEQDRIREDHGYATSTPVCDGERLYVFFGASGVYAFDLNGRQLWRTPVGETLNGWGSANSLSLHKDLVLVNASIESESLIALRRDSGKEVWRVGGMNESWNMPLVIDVPGKSQELIVAKFGQILGLNPATGETLWTCETNIQWYMTPSLVADKGIVYCIGGRSGGALAVRAGGRGDVTKTHRLWTGRNGSNVSSPIYHDGHLYFANDNSGIVYCVKADTGKTLYEKRLDRCEQVYASPILADGKLYYLSRSGQAYVVAAKPTFEQIAYNDFDERSVFNASPAVVGNRLLIRSDKTLYCIGKK